MKRLCSGSMKNRSEKLVVMPVSARSGVVGAERLWTKSNCSHWRLWVILLLLLLLATGCRLARELPPTPASVGTSDLQLQLPAAETYLVEQGDIVNLLTFPGTITMRRQVELSFEEEGRIQTSSVQSGDFVRAGALLVELDTDALNIALAEAEWDLEILQQQHAIAAEEQRYARQLADQEIKIAELTLASLLAKELDAPGTVLPETIAAAEHALTASELALKRLDRTDGLSQQKEVVTAQVQIQQLQRQLERSRIVAPFAGNVYFIAPFDALQRLPVNAYEPVIRLVDPDSLAVEATLPEETLRELAESMAASLTLRYRPGVVLQGTIQQLPFPYGAGSDGLTYLTVPATEQSMLRVGGTVDVTIQVQPRTDVLWLPPRALQEVGGRFYATVKEGELLREVTVQVGVQTNEQVEIVAGLAAGDLVVRR